MKLPWFVPPSLQVLALLAGALVATTAFPEDPPPNDEDLILGGITLGYPLITPTQTGTLTYTAGGGTVGTFVVNSVPDAVNYSATVKYNFINPPAPALSLQFGVDKSSCILDPATNQARNCLISPSASNSFQITGKVLGPDGVTVIDGAQGTPLFSGTVIEFGFLRSGTGTDFFDLRLQVSGGLMVPFIPLGSQLGVTVGAEGSSFMGRFDQSFTASPVKPNVGPIQPLLGDRVWEDLNSNGIQDCTYAPGSLINTSSWIPTKYDTTCEPGIRSVKVYLVDCNTPTTILATATTNSQGFYSFTGATLQPAPTGAQYCVKFDPSTVPTYCTTKYPTGPGGTLKFTQPFVGGPLTDSNANPTTGVAPPVTLLPSEINRSVDAGLYCPSALGDTVWNDTNKNGLQDNLNQANGEQGINDLTVQLYDCSNNPLKTTSTGPAPATATPPQVAGGAGWYGFSDLAPGCYQVKFTPPANFTFSPQNQGGSIVLDSNPNPATGITGQITLATGTYNPTLDAGVYELPPPQNSSLGNFFWHDLNANGIQEPNEPGINNVLVTLLNGSCQPLTPPITKITDSNGLYQFSNLQAGNYCEQFGKPTNFCQFGSSMPSFSPEKAPGSTPANDSDADLTTGQTGQIMLPVNTYDDTWDAGVYCPAQLGNFVWQDCNQNGIQDDAIIPGCTYGGGYPNVTVRLLDCSGNPVTDLNGNSSVTTAANGLYTFLVNPGRYSVEFVKPNGTVFTTPYVGSNPTIDSDANPTTGRTECTLVPSNTNNDTLDAGVYTPTQPKVTLKKFTNGYDGDNASGNPTITPPNGPSVPGDNQLAEVAVGGTVIWTYQVTNTGNEPLANIVVTDPRATAQNATIDCGNGTNTIASLAVGASATCTATLPGGAVNLAYGPPEVVPGCSDGNKIPTSPTYENTGTVTANGQYSGTAVSASDLSHYCNPKPAMKLKKFTNGWDADLLNGAPTPTPPIGPFTEGGYQVPQVAVGGGVTWTYRVTNTGNEPLVNVKVTDPAATAQNAAIICPGGTDTIVSLAVGQSIDCVATLPGGAKLLTLGGNVYLGCGNGGINTRPTYENTGYVSGSGQLSQNTVNASDLSHYCNPVTPGVKLVKFTNGFDGDNLNGVPLQTPPDGLFVVGGDEVAQVNEGDGVTWTYQVTNTGNEPLANVTVTDSVLPATAIICNGYTNNVIPLLPVKGVVDCVAMATASKLVVNGSNVKLGCGSGGTPVWPTYENTGFVSAKGQYSRMSVGDSNVSHYCNSPDIKPPKPEVTLKKYTNGWDGDILNGVPTAGTGPGTLGGNQVALIAPNSTVIWTYVVTNTGNTVLNNVTVADATVTNLGATIKCNGSTNNIVASLAVNASVTCTASLPAQSLTYAMSYVKAGCGSGGTNTRPTYENMGRVDAKVPDNNPVPTVSAEDPSHYCNPVVPGVKLTKYTNGWDGNNLNGNPTPGTGPMTPGGNEVAEIASGSPVTWTYRVTNTGNIALQNLTVTDPTVTGSGATIQCPGTGNNNTIPTLAVGASVDCTATATAPQLLSTMSSVKAGCGNGGTNTRPTYENTGTVTGSSTDGTAVQSSDLSHYCNPPGQDLCVPATDTSGHAGEKVATLVWNIDPVTGDVTATYDQFTTINDNSYGTNVVSWGSKTHTFSNLTGSDKAEFVFKDAAGNTVVDAIFDYITQATVTPSTPSGYKTLCAGGGDGKVVTGGTNILGCSTSIADNLNNNGYCTNGNCTVDGTNLLVNSPETVSSTSHALLNPTAYPDGWDYNVVYTVKVSKAAFGASGFGSVAVPSVHNSPPKFGANELNPVPCVPTQPVVCTTGTKPISADFEQQAIAGGSSIWFNSIFKVKSGLGSSGGVIRFNNSKVTFTASGVNYTLPVPDSEITFSSSATTASTAFVNGKWVTTVPAGFSGNVFLAGLPYQTAGGLTGGIKDVTWTGTFTSSTSNVNVEWKWAAAVYNPFNGDGNALGVKPIDGDKQNPYKNSDHAGTPESYKSNVQKGARGGGGSNYTGSYSGTATATTCAFQCSGVIGDYVWKDTNKDGIQGSPADEPGIAGATVTLSDSAGNVLKTTTTDANGKYQFTGLCAGTYQVKATVPGYTVTMIGQGTLATDSNPNPDTVILPTDNASDLTYDFGFVPSTVPPQPPGTNMCTLDTSGKPTVKAGRLYVTVLDNGDVKVKYDQDRNLNDNTYGVNAIGWVSRSHTFSNLTGSDGAEFRFFKNGDSVNAVLDFQLDYISAKTGTPSGYANLGVSGGDGRLNKGLASWVLDWNSSLARNLNDTGLCVNGNCTVNGVTLTVNSPPADSNFNVTDPAFSGWNFTDSYEVTVSGAAFGTAGFGSVTLPQVHNSPAKTGTNAVSPVPCVPQ